MLDWAIVFVEQHAKLFLAMTLVSLLSGIIAVTVGVLVVARLPRDYFVNETARKNRVQGYPAFIRLGWPLVKNVLGGVLVVAGVLMLVLPGQGLLTLVVGILMVDFPGKFGMLHWLVQKRQVRNSINWLRRRAGEPPLILD